MNPLTILLVVLVVIVPHTPNTLTDLFGQIRNAIITGSELARHPNLAPSVPPPDQQA